MTNAPEGTSKVQGGRNIALFKPFSHEDRVLVIITADPDSIASAVALKRLLWRRVSHVTIASTNDVKRPDNLRLVTALKLSMPSLGDLDVSSFSKLAMVDSQPSHNPATRDLKFAAVVDHHPVGPTVSSALQPDFCDIRPEWGATATIFANYLKAAKIRPNQVLATALFYAIKTDTQNFVRQGQIEDMRAFRWLYPLIHQPLLSEIERAPINKKSFSIMLKALNQTIFSKNFAFVFFEDLDHADTLVLAADFIMQINGVNRSITCGVHDGKLVIVLRSAGLRSSNLGVTAQKAFGQYGSAGGHKNMARAEIPLNALEHKGPLKTASLKNFVIKKLKDVIVRKTTQKDAPASHKEHKPHAEKTN
ncbi:MAG: DHH family phosphoesterase [Deltaproteobacteria bacterium]|jgi:nanoRNase/pAp phosphatase (c-di-AMP/oligoRNAs hydrolase)|nr:DHH family phosphoesterase [Deltaproteobacteria bacterium]